MSCVYVIILPGMLINKWEENRFSSQTLLQEKSQHSVINTTRCDNDVVRLSVSCVGNEVNLSFSLI